MPLTTDASNNSLATEMGLLKGSLAIAGEPLCCPQGSAGRLNKVNRKSKTGDLRLSVLHLMRRVDLVR
jgi:hypothetical protein